MQILQSFGKSCKSNDLNLSKIEIICYVSENCNEFGI